MNDTRRPIESIATSICCICLICAASLTWGCGAARPPAGLLDPGDADAGDADTGDPSPVDAGPARDTLDASFPPDLVPSPGDLLAPRDTPALLFSVKGRINDQTALEQGSALRLAAGWIDTAAAEGPQVLDEEVRIYRYDTSAERRSLVIEAAHNVPGGSHARQQRQFARVMIDIEALGPLASDGRVELDQGGIHSAATHLQTFVRRADGAALAKDCYTGLFDPVHPAGARLLLAAPWSTQLQGGDVVYAWGNLPLQTDPAALAAIGRQYGFETHQGLPCGCYLDGAPLPCATWEEEALQTGAELDCALPDGFVASQPSTATVLFKGPIGASGGTPNPPGIARVEALVGGKSYPLGAGSYAQRYTFTSGTWTGKPIVEITSYGKVEPLAPQRLAYDVLVTRVPVGVLDGLKKAPTYHRPPGPSLDLFAMLARGEQIDLDGELHTQLCVVAISDVNASELHVCHDSNQSFGPPEQLQLAAKIGLVTDPKALVSMLGSAAPCYCSVGDVSVDCGSGPFGKDTP